MPSKRYRQSRGDGLREVRQYTRRADGLTELTATSDSLCDTCHDPIYAGTDRIVRNPYGEWAHSGCVPVVVSDGSPDG